MADQELWTLDQLTEHVEAALAVDYPGPPSARVREVPNQRAIRWYITRGLVDPPAATRGRQALYGRRHLLQLVAVKRLQARGLPLAHIQAELGGLPDRALSEIALIDGPGGAAESDGHLAAWPPADGHAAAGRIRFWAAAAQPAGVRPASGQAMQAIPAAALDEPAPSRFAATAAAQAAGVRAVRLAPGVLLVLDAEAAGSLPDVSDDTLRAAAAPLRDLLIRPGKTDEGIQP